MVNRQSRLHIYVIPPWLLSEIAHTLGYVEDEKYYKQYSDIATEVYETYLINKDGTVRFTEKKDRHHM